LREARQIHLKEQSMRQSSIFLLGILALSCGSPVSERRPNPSTEQTTSPRQRRKILLRLGVGCLAIFALGYLVVFAVEKIQDMTDRAH
jgi:hypothetical protein